MVDGTLNARSNYACLNIHAAFIGADCEGGFDLLSPSCCATPSLRRVAPTNSFGTHPWFVPTHHMAAKKKTNASTLTEPPASTEPPTSAANAIVPTNAGNNNREDNSEDTLEDDLADGEFEVELLDMGIATEDIQATQRIDACLAERSRNARQAATQADPSTVAMTTRAKGKQRALTTEELEDTTTEQAFVPGLLSRLPLGPGQ